MPALLTSSVTDEQRIGHDRHSTGIVLAVLALLGVYAWLFTSAAFYLGLPHPQQLAASLDLNIPFVFDRDLNVLTRLSVHQAREFTYPDDSMLVLMAIVTGAFLCAYYLPLRYKQGSLALWTLLGIGILYGSQAMAALLAMHLAVYLVLHPSRGQGWWISALAGLAACHAFLDPGGSISVQVLYAIGLSMLAVGIYTNVVLPMLQQVRAAAVMRSLVVHVAVLVICVNLVIDALGGSGFTVALGVLLFFYQWARLVMYHIDYQDGLVPESVGLGRYLAVFLSPGVLPTWTWVVTIPQGYAYVNNHFLDRDKNYIVLQGLKLLGVALLYLVFWLWAIRHIEILLNSIGMEAYRTSVNFMVHRFMQGDDIDTASVLLVTMLEIVRSILIFAGVVHFKVGLWRICGYNIEPYINKPWLATNLMAFWTRYAYYFREFLVRTFYYPVFFRLAGLPAPLRIIIASLAAAGVGNIIIHLLEQNLTHGMDLAGNGEVLFTWPYFLLLGAGIGVSMIVMRKRKRIRRAWTLDRWIVLDLVAAYVTIQYFALIHVFARPTPDSTLGDLARLFLLGLGIDLR